MHARSAIQELSETHTHGPDTDYRVVRASEKDTRTWLRGSPVCVSLAQHRIAHAGIMTARAPYRIVRMHQGGLYFLACLEGTSGTEKGAPKPNVWSERAKFDAAARAMQDEAAKLAVAARANNLDQLKAAFGATAATCKACHDDFRVQ